MTERSEVTGGNGTPVTSVQSPDGERPHHRYPNREHSNGGRRGEGE